MLVPTIIAYHHFHEKNHCSGIVQTYQVALAHPPPAISGKMYMKFFTTETVKT